MPLIAVQLLKPGMVVSDDVTDANGRMLLAREHIIEDKHLTVFKMWGVPEVAVKADGAADDDAPALPDPVATRQVAEALRPRFVNNDLTHPAVAEIFRQAVMHRSRKGDIGAGGGSIGVAPTAVPPQRFDLRSRIRRREIRLPEIPSIIFTLNDIIADPFSSADDIAQVISKSPGLAALLLKIVNSAFYGFPTRIDSVARAVTIIGSKEVSALAVGITTMKVFKDIPETVFDMQAFTHHSLACGVLARILAAGGNIRNTEQLFVSGLLHDIGRLVVFKYFSREAAFLLSDAQRCGVSLYEHEKAVLGCRHTDIAADLFEKWKFPVSLIQNVVCHHRPMAAQDPARAAIVHLADIIAHSLGEGRSGEWQIPAMDRSAWDALRFSPRLLATVIPQALHHLSFLMGIIKSGE